MGFFSRLLGSVSSFFQIGGANGPGWSAPTTGGLEARNAAQSAFVVARAADPVGPNDLVTKQFAAANPATIQPLALSAFAFNEGTTFVPTQYTVGMAFYTTLPFTMTGIRLYWRLFNVTLSDTFTVSLWNSGGTLLGQASMTVSANGEYTVLFGTPVVLPSEGLYTIGYCCTVAGGSSTNPYTPYAQTGQSLLPPINSPTAIPQFAGPGVMYKELSLLSGAGQVNVKPTSYPFSTGAFMPLQPVFQ